MTPNGWRYEHVAGFGVIHYQNTPKLDARLKDKLPYKPRHCLRTRVGRSF